jgi:hypothetical protein
MSDLPVVPGGVRAGQVSVLLLGKVIVGDIAVTLVDLAVRGLLAVEPADGDDWTLAAEGAGAGDASVVDYERRLLAGLARAGTPARLSALSPGFGKHMDKARSEIVAAAVRDGWIRRFHHEQRTGEGEKLAARVRSFRWSLRRTTAELPEDVLAGSLLPYALRFGLAADDGIPLARFAHAAVRALVNEPGWAPPQPERREDDVPTSGRGSGYADGAYTGGAFYGGLRPAAPGCVGRAGLKASWPGAVRSAMTSRCPTTRPGWVAWRAAASPAGPDGP